MSNRIRDVWQQLSDSLWFLPALIVFGAAALAVGMIELSNIVDRESLERLPRLFGAGADSSRSMLATIAGSMITVAGVTFSITIVAVSQASSQYTPRILRNFMRDRPSQLVLGILVGTFVYCLIVMRTIRSDEEQPFIPALAVIVAFLLAIVGIGFLVYFLHHIAGTLEAGSILARVRRETVASVDRLFPDELGESASDSAGESLDVSRKGSSDTTWLVVLAASTGYIQGVDAEGLLSLASECGVVVRMERGIGEFVVEGTPLASISGVAAAEVPAGSLNALYTVSSHRTVRQDAAFGVQQIVDIALKALSPGANDTTTAVISVDQLGAVLVRLATRRIEAPERTRDGEVRVIARGPTFASLLDTALHEIRRSGASNVTVLARMLRTIDEVAACTSSTDRLERLRQHAELIVRTAEHNVDLLEDRASIIQGHRRVEDRVRVRRARS